MRIPIEQLKQARVALEFESAVARFPALRNGTAGDGAFTGPVHASVTAERVGELVEVRGVVRGAARLVCSRCLAEFTAPLESEFELTYARQPDGANEASEPVHPQPGADDGLIRFHGDEIDLTAGVQEHLILALPLKPLCSESCRGLCARCGADLNQGPCGCAADRGGGSFQALGRLKLSKDA